MVLDLHQFAIGGGLREPQNRTMIYPRMAGQDAVGFTRLEQDSRQRLHSDHLEFRPAAANHPPEILDKFLFTRICADELDRFESVYRVKLPVISFQNITARLINI